MPLVKKQLTRAAEDKDDIVPPISDHPPQIDPQFTILRSDGFTAEILNVPSAATPPPPPGAEQGTPYGRPSEAGYSEAGYNEIYEGGNRGLSQHPPVMQQPPPLPRVEAESHPNAPFYEKRGSLSQQQNSPESRKDSRLSGVFHRRRSRSATTGSRGGPEEAKSQGKERRLSAIFHRHRSGSRGSRTPSPTLPEELEHIIDGEGDPEDNEAQWEKRATVLAQQGGAPPPPQSHRPQQLPVPTQQTQSLHPPRPVEGLVRTISDAKSDDDIQKAIELHETGELEQSTAMFGRLADPDGANNALSQVLYGLALRHGWGIPTDPNKAVSYLTLAARNSAAIESQALESGMKKGGAAKGELVLAIYELANCYKMGLGVPKDPMAARRYFETAARLGDVDALEAAARCYEDGFGGKKDKFMAAKYYRQAEEKGHKIVGNSWIWKDKYDPKPSGGS